MKISLIRTCKWAGCAVALWFGGVGAGLADEAAPAETMSPRVFTLAELESDFDHARATILEQHPLLYTDRAAFDEVIARQRPRLREGMSDLEFLRVVSPVIRAINCGHAELSLSQGGANRLEKEGRLLPLSIKVIGGRLRVLKSLPASSVPAGAEILRIDGRPGGEIVAGMCDSLPGDGDNVTRKLFFLSERFHEWYRLLVSSGPSFEVEYVDPASGGTISARLEGVTKPAWSVLQDDPRPGDAVGDYAFAEDHAWLYVKSFMFYDEAGKKRLNGFIDEFFAELAARGVASLVLDLRGNGGGDPYGGAYLLSHLIDRPVVYFAESGSYYAELKSEIVPAANAFGGRLFVLIDGGVFSTTGHLCSLLKFHGIGEFVGEETGGSFACTANSREEILPHTGLRLVNATTMFRTAVDGLTPGRGIMPDHPVEPSVADLLAGRDAVRARAISLIRNSSTGN